MIYSIYNTYTYMILYVTRTSTFMYCLRLNPIAAQDRRALEPLLGLCFALGHVNYIPLEGPELGTCRTKSAVLHGGRFHVLQVPFWCHFGAENEARPLASGCQEPLEGRERLLKSLRYRAGAQKELF